MMVLVRIAVSWPRGRITRQPRRACGDRPDCLAGRALDRVRWTAAATSPRPQRPESCPASAAYAAAEPSS